MLDDPNPPAPESVTRMLLCTGKIGHELIAERDRRGATAVVVRAEQLYPVPVDEVAAILARHPNIDSLLWVQEEPENMGARIFAMPFLQRLVPEGIRVSYVARSQSASPASGSSKVHDAEQAQLLAAAFDGC